jgi:hypothetical protein
MGEIKLCAMRIPTIYQDRKGTLFSEIISNGQQLELVLENIKFIGHSFDDLSPLEHGSKSNASINRFTLHRNCLCACKLHCIFPLFYYFNNQTYPIEIQSRIYLGIPVEHGGLDHVSIILKCRLPDDNTTKITRFHNSFDNAFEELLHQIRQERIISNPEPFKIHFKCCYCCAFSDYFPGGWGIFGELFCFRDVKELYRAVMSKDELFEIWDKNSGSVQETWLCDEFKQRIPNTGYRG